jgi:GrpB-like predicted nucleotidyltransferase (UPF0157 family)
MKSHQKENRYMRASPKRKSALSRLNKPLALRNGEANNRTGYEKISIVRKIVKRIETVGKR